MTRITSIIILGILLSALMAADAAAQWNVARFDAGRSRVYTTFGMDPAFVTSIGYARTVPWIGRHFQFTGEAGVATARLDANDFRGRLGVQASVVRWRSVHLTAGASAIARGTENSVYRGFNWGADVTGTLGVYRRRWFAAGELTRDKAIITHVTHTDWYRANVFPDAKDGWYLDAGGTYRYGFSSGLTLGRTELVGRFGWQRTEKGNDLPSPFYASVGVGFGL